MSEQEKEQNQFLIIEMDQRKPQMNNLLTSPFNDTFKMFKERIIVMNKTIISSKKVYIVTSLVMAAVGQTSTIASFVALADIIGT